MLWINGEKWEKDNIQETSKNYGLSNWKNGVAVNSYGYDSRKSKLGKREMLGMHSGHLSGDVEWAVEYTSLGSEERAMLQM